MTVVIFSLGLASLLLISTTLLFADTQNEAPPDWAIGEWELSWAGEGPNSTFQVQPDGNIIWHIPRAPYLGTGRINSGGHLELRAWCGYDQGIVYRASGQLGPTGTSQGTGGPAFIWTAVKPAGQRPDPNTYAGEAPFWAVGEWQVQGPGDDTATLKVQPDGSASLRFASAGEMAFPAQIERSQGCIKVSVEAQAFGGKLDLVGRLTAQDTGRGISGPLLTWTATKVPGPEALIEQPGPEIQIECKFVEIQKDPDEPLARDWQDNPEQWLREQLTAGKAELINMPRITTRNGVPAKAELSTDIPYFSAQITYDEYGKRTVEYKEDTVTIVQSISVTPTLQADGQILMDIDFRVDGQAGTVVGPNGEVLPIVTTQSGSTQARVADGETLVIGGQGTLHRKMPLAHQGLPITGRLFRSRLAAQPNKELLIFVTPKVIPGTEPSALGLPESGVISGEIRDGEQWVWDSIALRYAEATEVARLFGGQTVILGPDGYVKTHQLMVPAKQPWAPPAGGGYGGGYGAATLPEGMDPPLAVVQQNVLIVHGTQEAIDQFREILAFFDKPAKQVEIEAKFVEIEGTKGKGTGIDWFAAHGSAEFFNQGFAPGQGISVARFRRGRFESELQALLGEGRAEVVNAPRVTTRNNVEAEVQFTTKIPYSYATITYDELGNRKVDYETDSVSVTQSLTVTPHILDDNSVVLDLEAEINDQVGTMVGPNGEVVPIVSTQSAYTRVRVADGDTIVIGGFTRTTEVLDPKQVLTPEETAPTEESERTEMRQMELLLFVTPRIIREIPRE